MPIAIITPKFYFYANVSITKVNWRFNVIIRNRYWDICY